ncbi:pyridoxine biosynthesis protein [Agyrium rufum]|nr:pyridoxine biosynthesis protein [Agyrium rufum]
MTSLNSTCSCLARVSSNALRTLNSPTPKQAINRRFASSSPSSSGQRYPLYPSVAQLLHEHHIPESQISSIPASGPKGRLLKGDILAYLGSIKKDYASDLAARILKLGHLDLSHIVIAPPAPPPTATVAAPQAAIPELPSTVSIAFPISLQAVRDVQQRIRTTLNIDIPLATFLERATIVANADLPKGKSTPLTSDELFNAVLGLDIVSRTETGSFVPQIAALPSLPIASRAASQVTREMDVIDLLAGKKSIRGVRSVSSAATAAAGPVTVFSVEAPKSKEDSAKVFLERMKGVLQDEPGRLVLP